MLKQIPHKKFAHYSALIACCGDKGDMATWQHICREVRLFSKQMRASVNSFSTLLFVCFFILMYV